MNFDDYMRKIQYISNILEKNEYAENILNSKELDIAQDFQYICLSSASNYKLVNEIIARLAQNGNSKIVEENVKSISMSMWKDLFDKNEAIKKIFINNFSYIFENTTIITFREIDRFINDKDTCILIYDTLDNIIKKLCTYDRASLISILKHKENGIDKIKQNLENFFQKGEFDISTTYSKILNELSQIPEISKIQILKACNNNLEEMLNRETAIDNETNKLLNWIYDAFEETSMPDEERYIIKQNIDNAILKNFNHILDKSNYDKNTIKILKQFDCTKEKFEKNKNHFIEKSNRLIIENQNSNLNFQDEKNYIKDNIVNSKKIDRIFENTKEQINKENIELKNIINEVNKNNNVINKNNNELDKNNLANKNNIVEDEIKENRNIISQNKTNLKNENANSEVNTTTETKSLINTYINEFAKKKDNIISMQNSNKCDKDNFDEKIQKLITNNIEETDKIINKILKKNEVQVKVTDNLGEIAQEKINTNSIEEIKNLDNKNLKNDKIEDIKPNNNNQSTELIVKEESVNTNKKVHIIKRILKKFTKLFKSKSTIERIGD